MKSLEELQNMTTREIALDAQRIINVEGYDRAKVMLENHITVANEKLLAFSQRVNKQLGTKKAAPRIRVITDFLRFK